MVVVGAVFNRELLGLTHTDNRGYKPLPPTINLGLVCVCVIEFHIWYQESTRLKPDTGHLVRDIAESKSEPQELLLPDTVMEEA